MRRVGRDLHEASAPVRRIGKPDQQPRVAKPLRKPHRAAFGYRGGDAERGHRQLFSVALVDEQVEQHIPRRLAEQFL